MAYFSTSDILEYIYGDMGPQTESAFSRHREKQTGGNPHGAFFPANNRNLNTAINGKRQVLSTLRNYVSFLL